MPEPVEEYYAEWEKAIGIKIKAILKGKGISANHLARSLNKEPAYLSRIIRGEINLTVKTLAEIEFALGEPIIEIASGQYSIMPIVNNIKETW